MNEALNKKRELSLFKKLMPYMALAILLPISVGVWGFYEDLSVRKEQRRFEDYTSEIVQDITERLDKYKMILQGGGGVFAASEEVSREEWGDYFTYRQIDTLYKGVQAVEYARVIQPSELARHIREIRAEGFLDYAVFPAGEREVYVPVIYIEPFNPANRRAFGYDRFAEPARRAAMLRARDTGQIAITSRLTLVQQAGREAGRGFLMYLPVYSGGMPIETVEERKAAIKGYISAVFNVNDLIQGIFPDGTPKIAFKLYDGGEPSLHALMHDSQIPLDAKGPKRTPMFTSVKTLNLYGHSWTIEFETTPDFEADTVHHVVKAILAGGIVISLLIFLFLKMLETTSKRAFSIAREMTSSLRETQEKYRLLAENSADAIWTINPEGHLTYISPAVENLIGYTPEEVMEMPMTEYIVKEDYDAIMERFAEKLAKSPADQTGPEKIEVRCRKKDGSLVYLEFSTMSLLDRGNNLIGIQGSTRDITERKEAEALAAAERHRLYTVLETLPGFVALVKPDYYLAYVNREFRDRFGDPADRRCYEALFGRESKCDDCRIPEVFRTGSPVSWEWTGPDGRIYLIKAYPYEEADGSSLVLSLGLDITEQKQVEKERIARRAAEEANQAKSMFLSNMSHEIRTPMNSILGFAHILEQDPSLTSKQMEQVRTISRSSRHLLDLINNVLDISKIEAGRFDLQPSVFSIKRLFEDLEMMFRSRADAKKLRLIMGRDKSLPPYVLGDESKLRQVLINLMGNAVKFTERGGVSVRVRSEAVEKQPVGKGQTFRLTVEVEDSGPGIPEADLEGIFETFGQAEAGIQTGGTGLGLAISRKLVEMMGGSLVVESEMGKGSCFRFDVLLESAEAVPELEKSESRRIVALEPGTGPWRILVVDDIASNRDLVRELLQPLGFEIREAENGVEALDTFHEWAPHAVLMDMRMPVMDGYEATRHIKAHEAGHATPVIAVTASAFKDSEEEVEATGVSAYLRKPFRPEELFDVLSRCLDLRYVYAEEPTKPQSRREPPALTPEIIIALPHDLVRAMRDAVDQGDMARLNDLLDQVEKLDRTAAQGLRVLADQYEYEKLDELLVIGDGNG